MNKRKFETRYCGKKQGIENSKMMTFVYSQLIREYKLYRDTWRNINVKSQ